MIENGLKSAATDLNNIGIIQFKKANWNLTPSELIEAALQNREGVLTETGALMCDTGKFTGRSPMDRYFVTDDITKDEVWWGENNIGISPETFEKLYNKMMGYVAEQELYIRDMFVGADKTYRMKVRVVNTMAWHNLFCYNMFIQPEQYQLEDFDPEFTIINCPGFKANPSVDGTRQENFSIINLTKKIILIGGTAYSGEMKKGVFSVLNFKLPTEHQVLPMHCSANVGLEEHDTALFFGLSGTGKTTLSASSDRMLIGDDEHGWTESTVFNFEGGCYAKTIGLSQEKEPEIYDAIKFGSILENTRFLEGKRTVDFDNTTVTQNTRVSYPIDYISNALNPSIGGIPKNIFLLTCDAFGVIPPLQRLTVEQAMYHFISGYTSKVAGTEAGVKDPLPVFSACYGAPFMPLHPNRYAKMLGEKMEKTGVKVWLVNTGWTGGSFGKGKRIDLPHTRALINAVFSGVLNNVGFRKHSIFGGEIPFTCPGVPSEILSPRETWKDDKAYYDTANALVDRFHKNFEQFSSEVSQEILDGQPKHNNKYG